MGASHITELRRRTVVALSGPEARAFLQRILTSDIDTVSQDRAAYAALLTPQGKILFDMFVAQAGDRFLVDCAASQKDELVKRLTFYKLRAQVDIEDMGSDHAVAALWGDDAQPGAGAAAGEHGLCAFADPRTPEAGLRVVAPRAALDRLADLFGAEQADELSYDRHRIALGLGDSDADIGSGRTFPHEANLDQFGGVDFTKGCYVGQEVVSRMQHRGTARKRILPVRFDGAPPAEGAEIAADGKSLGTMLSGVEGMGLALLRLDRMEVAFADGAALSADGKALVPVRPGWARFPVPGTGVDA